MRTLLGQVLRRMGTHCLPTPTLPPAALQAEIGLCSDPPNCRSHRQAVWGGRWKPPPVRELKSLRSALRVHI